MLYRLGHSLQRWWGKKESKKFFGRHSTPQLMYNYIFIYDAELWSSRRYMDGKVVVIFTSFLQQFASFFYFCDTKKTTTTSGSSSSSSMFVCCKKKRRAQGLLFFSFFALSRKEGVVGSAARAHNITEVATG